MRRSLLIGGAVAGAIFIATASLFIAKSHRTASRAEAALAERTGVGLTFSGVPSLSAWPDWAVSLSNVSIPSAQGAGAAPFLTAAQLTLGLDSGPFVLGSPRVTSATLTDARINLTIDRDGKASWGFAGPGDGRSDTEADLGDGLPVHIANGTLVYRDERSGLAFEVSDIEAASMVTGPDGEFSANGTVVWNKQSVKFNLFLKSPRRLGEDGSPIDLNLSSPAMELQMSGRMVSAGGLDLSGQTTVKASDMRALASWFGTEVPGYMGLHNFEITGALDASQSAIAFKGTKFSFDDMHGRGDLEITRNAGGRMAIDAKLGMDRIDFNAYRTAEVAPSVLTLLETGWSVDTLAFGALKKFDANLLIATNQIIKGDLKTGPARMEAALAQGILKVKLDDVTMYGGTAEAQMVFDSTQGLPTMSVDYTGKDLDAEPALRGALSFGKFAGKLSTTFTAETSGSSLAEMVARLKASGSFRIAGGQVNDMDMIAMIRRATEQITEGWPLDPSLATQFDALSAAFTVTDGLVETQNLILSGPTLSIAVKGEIDLARQAFDFACDPRYAITDENGKPTGRFATLPVALLVKGPWTLPRIYPDMPGILDDPDAAFRAFKKLSIGTAATEVNASPSAN